MGSLSLLRTRVSTPQVGYTSRTYVRSPIPKYQVPGKQYAVTYTYIVVGALTIRELHSRGTERQCSGEVIGSTQHQHQQQSSSNFPTIMIRKCTACGVHGDHDAKPPVQQQHPRLKRRVERSASDTRRQEGGTTWICLFTNQKQPHVRTSTDTRHRTAECL